jgi:xyloglucan-specific endo-beta-1,4-glucanase
LILLSASVGMACGGTNNGSNTNSSGGYSSTGSSAGGALSGLGGTSTSGGSAPAGGGSATGGIGNAGGSAAAGGAVALGGSTATGGTTDTAATAATGGVTTACPSTTQQNKTNINRATIALGKYYVENNAWSVAATSPPSAVSEYVWSTCSSGDTIGWGTSYDWGGATNAVKAYPAAILGWHWDWGWLIPQAATGLPLSLSSSTASATCSWSFYVTGSAVIQNVSYDLWFHTVSAPASVTADAAAVDTPTDELMVWLYYSGGALPAGTLQTTASVAGEDWSLYRGVIGSWNVYSYMRTSTTYSATVDLMSFVRDVVNRGWMDNTKYLTSIQAGSEIFVGTGQVDTGSYSCATTQ